MTAASDLYSIGVILYELLAGRLPFEGDSAVSVALKHLSEPPPPLSQLRPDVDPGLESVIMAALAKDPARRWQSAEEFAKALTTVGEHIVAGSGRRGQDTAAFEPIVAPVPVPDGWQPVDGAPPTVLADAERPPTSPHEVAVAEAERRRRRWPWVALGLLVLLLAGLFGYLAMAGLLAPEKVTVPKVVGRQVLNARERLERAGFRVRERRTPSQEEIGVVVDQDPNAATKADKGSTVLVQVSQGPGNVAVPSVSNLARARAIKQLNDAGLKVNEDPEHSDTVKEGFAIRTVPREGEQVQRGTRVRLLVSSGPEQVTLPDLVGLSRESAEAKLDDLGLLVSIDEQDSNEPEGEVIASSPGGGTRLDPGSRVTLTVSKGPKKVEVPDVSGLRAGPATQRLRAAGFEVAQREQATTNAGENGVVLEQRPPAGSEIDSGRTVVIVVGKLTREGENPETTPLPSPPPSEGDSP